MNERQKEQFLYCHTFLRLLKDKAKRSAQKSIDKIRPLDCRALFVAGFCCYFSYYDVPMYVGLKFSLI